MTVGIRVQVSPEELVAGGDSLSRIDGFPIFVPALYPGDVAMVEIDEVRKGYARGVVAELTTPGPLRRLLPCPIAAECGGCDWTALRLDHQLRAKERILLDSLRRVGKLERDRLPVLRIHPSPLNYRLRSRLHVDSEGRTGFFALRSNTVVPLAMECEVVGPGVLEQWEEIERIAADARNDSIETFETDRMVTAAPISAGASGERGASPREHRVQGARGAPLPETEIRNAAPLAIRVGEFTYRLSISTFFQVNRHLLPLLVALIEKSGAAARSHRRAFDLYAGVGFFTLPLSRIFEEVVGVESSPRAHALARKNASGRKGIRTVGESVEQFLRRDRDADFIVVDPPRAGLSPEVIEGLDASRAARICYLSCDPVTFSRDASRLVRRGWTPVSLDLLDLFPNTHHIETLSSFERAQ